MDPSISEFAIFRRDKTHVTQLHISVSLHSFFLLQVLQENKWFDRSCHIPKTLSLEPLDPNLIHTFKEVLSNKPASATACGDLTSHQLSKLACSRWLTDEVVESLANLFNRSSQDCLCLVLSEFHKFRLRESIMSALHGRNTIRLIFLIVNVQIDAVTQTAVASNKLMSVNHWTVLATDVTAKTSYYGDPLGYPIPTNLLVETKEAFAHLGSALDQRIGIFQHVAAMHRPLFDANGKHICSRQCLNFPVQTCSSLCGVIAFIFAAVAAFCPSDIWQYICSPQLCFHKARPKLSLYSHLSAYAHYLRNVLVVWLLSDKMNIQNIVDKSVFEGSNSLLHTTPSRHIRSHRLSLTLKQTTKVACSSTSYMSSPTIANQSTATTHVEATSLSDSDSTAIKMNSTNSSNREAKSTVSTNSTVVDEEAKLNPTIETNNRNIANRPAHHISDKEALPAHIIPVDYEYVIENYVEHTPESFLGSEKHSFTLRAWTNVHNQSGAVKWIEDFQNLSKTNYCITRGSHISGTKILFKTI
ncbi:uncharacterized protein LOC134195452 [Corticium candelabrum]|uniref:uncharacterized protein LOC134195452 n=1 Tax=Corticium candelabrum TaxID=121492 RepID=UPI002E272781|nr:uncharacterized protein LOC134195452 [Corticium candelabrum]